MEIRETTEHGITVIELEGRFDAPSAPEAEDAFRRVTDKGIDRVVLDLSGVEYISSGGLRAIIVLLKTMNRNAGSLAVCGLNPFVSEVFEITHLADRLNVQATRAQALQALQA
jgi:stage II sporulation protein AA (anti-sigma F factor antagonist)